MTRGREKGPSTAAVLWALFQLWAVDTWLAIRVRLFDIRHKMLARKFYRMMAIVIRRVRVLGDMHAATVAARDRMAAAKLTYDAHRYTPPAWIARWALSKRNPDITA